MSEYAAAEHFLYNKLKLANLGTDIHNASAPDGAHYPLTVYNNMTAVDVGAIEGNPLYVNTLYLVKCIVQSTEFTAADELYDKAHAALNLSYDYETPFGLVVSCKRESPYSNVETIGNTEYRTRGGIYRIRIN